MAQSAADRQRAMRRRGRQGLTSRRIDVGDDTYSTFLYLGWLTEAELDDDEAVHAALTRMAADWAKANNPYL